MMQQTQQLRSSVASNDAGPTSSQHITSLRTLSKNSILEIEKTITEGEGQSSKHQTQKSDNEGKILLHSRI